MEKRKDDILNINIFYSFECFSKEFERSIRFSFVDDLLIGNYFAPGHVLCLLDIFKCLWPMYYFCLQRVKGWRLALERATFLTSPSLQWETL